MVDLILFDFSKAFDLVNHDILLTKLSQLGIGGPLFQWITDFLKGRTMRVVVGGEESSPTGVTSGVPQGSVLGPVLFLIYINFVANNFTCKHKIFPDDLKIYLKLNLNASSILPDLSVMQRDIDLLVSRAESWGLKINSDKTVALRFSRGTMPNPAPCYYMNGSPIHFVDSLSDLGLLIDTFKVPPAYSSNCQ